MHILGLEKNKLHKSHVSGIVGSLLLMQDFPICLYIIQICVSDFHISRGYLVHLEKVLKTP